MIHLIKILIIT